MEKKIKLHDKVFKPFIPNEQVEAAIDAVAEKMNADYRGSGKVPVLLCVLNGSIVFTAGPLDAGADIVRVHNVGMMRRALDQLHYGADGEDRQQ